MKKGPLRPQSWPVQLGGAVARIASNLDLDRLQMIGGIDNSPVVHIGLQRAASTFLQTAVFPHLDGWRYFSDLRSISQLTSKPWPQIDCDVVDAFRHAWQPGTIFSTEAFAAGWSSNPTPLCNLAKLGHDFGMLPVILVVIRRQDDWWESMFRYKARYFRRPERMFADRRPLNLDYSELDARLRSLGFSKIVYVAFEDLVADTRVLATVFGKAALNGEFRTNPVNASMRYEVLGYQFLICQAVLARAPKFGKYWPRVSVNIDRLKKERFLRLFAESNRQLSARANLNLDRHGYF